MQGVTTAIVAFIFVCIVFPSLVKVRPQFYAALAAVLVIILLDSLSQLITAAAFQTFAYLMGGVLQIGAILLLFLACGGLTIRELAGDMARAYEVIRRGEEEKEVIIPLSGQPTGQAHHEQEKPDDDSGRTVYNIDTQDEPAWPTQARQPARPPEAEAKGESQRKPSPEKPDRDTSLPLE